MPMMNEAWFLVGVAVLSFWTFALWVQSRASAEKVKFCFRCGTRLMNKKFCQHCGATRHGKAAGQDEVR